MILRCEDCRSAVDVGSSENPQRWYYRLWDHLLDLHRDRATRGDTLGIEFAGRLVRVHVADGKVVR